VFSETDPTPFYRRKPRATTNNTPREIRLGDQLHAVLVQVYISRSGLEHHLTIGKLIRSLSLYKLLAATTTLPQQQSPGTLNERLVTITNFRFRPPPIKIVKGPFDHSSYVTTPLPLGLVHNLPIPHLTYRSCRFISRSIGIQALRSDISHPVSSTSAQRQTLSL